jgi:single-stranded DNA-binding protein
VSGRLRQRSYEIKEGEERTGYEVVVDGTDASAGWFAWSPLAPRDHSPLPPAETADRNRRLGRVEALLPYRE